MTPQSTLIHNRVKQPDQITCSLGVRNSICSGHLRHARWSSSLINICQHPEIYKLAIVRKLNGK